MSHPGEADPRVCNPEKVFELADQDAAAESLEVGEERELRNHLARCRECRELYERELDLNAFLSSLDFQAGSRSVHRGVAMSLPTRSAGGRVMWGLLAVVLLLAALSSLELEAAQPIMLSMGILGAFWALISSSVEVLIAIVDAAGLTILLLLVLGALADLLIALAVVFSRRRRAQEA
ncbi:MAG TPA: hypothetical protein VEY13_07995 [Rubrobacteraceae bacterium]|jgi:hypothetical protein|nr:hypothetical protein [Rubrobacteraceae bacterium]